jgi:hypothetical protein
MNKTQIFPAAALISISALAIAGCSTPQTPAIPDVITVQTKEQNVISVNSSEAVKVVPDMAQIRFGISTQAEDAKACQEKNSEDLNRVIQFLKDSGFSDTSIQVSNYGMNPIYDYSSGRTPVGYETQATIVVSDITIDQAAVLLGDCVDRGINNIDSVSYLSSKYEECYQEALTQAIDAARQKAQVMAEAGGCTLGSVVRIQEYSSSQAARYDNTSFTARSLNNGVMAADMVMEPGQLSIEAQISVDFSIQ